MLRNVLLAAVAVSALSLSAASLRAQEAVLGQLYGSGVHAYFAGDYLTAYENLSSAIEGGTSDPRAYYFRGLTYMKLGRPEEAREDFSKGAELESQDVNQVYNVPQALQRIQGSTRLALEKYRMEARMARLEEAQRVQRVRYEQMRQEEQRLLEQQGASQVELPAEAPSVPAQPQSPFEVLPEPGAPGAEPGVAEPPMAIPGAAGPGSEQPAEPLQPATPPPGAASPF